MSSITLIGTGNMARTIGTLAVAGGNTVEVMGRDQSKAADLAKALGGGATTGAWGAVPAGDIVILAVPYASAAAVIDEYGDALDGTRVAELERRYEAWSRQGVRVLAIAARQVEQKPAYSREDERDLFVRGREQLLDEREGRLVCPVEVFEHEAEGAFAGEA